MMPLRIRAARCYVSPRERELSSDEERVREIAYSLKELDSSDIDEAADAMAPLVREERVILSPVPSLTTGVIGANGSLCSAIVKRLPKEQDVRVMALVHNNSPVDSQCMRHRRGDSPRSEIDFPFTASPEMGAVNLHYYGYGIMFVDNVVTSGNTLRACARVIGMPGAFGLVWADARATLCPVPS